MEIRVGRGATYIRVYAVSSRVTAAQLDLVLMEEGGEERQK